MGDPEMTRHLGGPETPEQLRRRHRRYYAPDGLETGRMFVIVMGTEAVGSVGYWEHEWQGELVWETGWSVLSEFQGRGLATGAVLDVIERARAERSHRFLHAFPSVDNGPSNALCRKVGFVCAGEVSFEYPPGRFMRCNDWRLELTPEPTGDGETPSGL